MAFGAPHHRAMSWLGLVAVAMTSLACQCGQAPLDDGGTELPWDGGAPADAGAFADGGALDGGGDDGGLSCLPPGAQCQAPEACCDGLCEQGLCFSPATCREADSPCSSAQDCCSLNCRSVGGAAPSCQSTGSCVSFGSPCSLGVECCSNACSVVCQSGGGGCLGHDAPCTADFACCSGTCSSGKCVGTGAACLAAGETATSDSQCCSGLRDGQNACRVNPLCRSRGEPCSSELQCCGQTCRSGYCQPLPWCLATFEPCETDIECCTGLCDRNSFGFKVCLPIGGCRASGPVSTPKAQLNEFGEICAAGSDCCSERCQPDAEGVLRCRKQGDPRSSASPRVCLPEGELCETDSECCVGKCDRPPTPPGASFAIPKRCLTGGGAPCRSAGAGCADPSQCCSGLCVLHPDDQYRCGAPPSGADAGTPADGGSCVPRGGACTNDRDCCSDVYCTPNGTGGLSCQAVVIN
jgi:hypothetical protein